MVVEFQLKISQGKKKSGNLGFWNFFRVLWGELSIMHSHCKPLIIVLSQQARWAMHSPCSAEHNDIITMLQAPMWSFQHARLNFQQRHKVCEMWRPWPVQLSWGRVAAVAMQFWTWLQDIPDCNLQVNATSLRGITLTWSEGCRFSQSFKCSSQPLQCIFWLLVHLTCFLWQSSSVIAKGHNPNVSDCLVSSSCVIPKHVESNYCCLIAEHEIFRKTAIIRKGAISSKLANQVWRTYEALIRSNKLN